MELDVVAHVDVEQVVADKSGDDLGRPPRRVPEELAVADFHLEQIVAGGRRLVERKIALPEGVQEAHADEPVVVAPIGAAAQPHGRNARHAAAVVEGGADEIVLAVDAEDAGRQRYEIPLPGDLAAAEGRVALRIERLNELGLHAAGRECLAAEDPGRLLEDEVLEPGVIGSGVEAERSVDALEAELGGLRSLDLERRVADIERARRVVSAVGEQLERGGRALDALDRGAGDHPRRQVLEHAEADALGRKAERLQRQYWIVRRRHQGRRKYAGGPVLADVLDASRQQRAQVSLIQSSLKK